MTCDRVASQERAARTRVTDIVSSPTPNPVGASAPPTMTPLTDYTSDHRLIVKAAAEAAGIPDPVSFSAGNSFRQLANSARRGELVPIDGVLTRDWYGSRNTWPGTQF